MKTPGNVAVRPLFLQSLGLNSCYFFTSHLWRTKHWSRQRHGNERQEELKVCLHSFSNSAADGGEWSDLHPEQKVHNTQGKYSCVGPTAGLFVSEFLQFFPDDNHSNLAATAELTTPHPQPLTLSASSTWLVAAQGVHPLAQAVIGVSPRSGQSM